MFELQSMALLSFFILQTAYNFSAHEHSISYNLEQLEKHIPREETVVVYTPISELSVDDFSRHERCDVKVLFVSSNFPATPKTTSWR